MPADGPLPESSAAVPPPSRWLRLVLGYDGTRFAGWQSQPDRRTVQDTFEAAWRSLTGEVLRVTARGRTDAGVHAVGQVVGLKTATRLSDQQLVRAINAHLPADVAVQQVTTVPAGFHATYDALRKRYRYHIHHGRARPLLDRHFVWHVPVPLDVPAMREGATHLVGRHDFVSFETAGSERATTVRTVSEVEIASPSTQRIEIDVEGDGFLYNMVRIIAGTLVEVGRGRRPPAWVAEVVAARDRRAAGPTAPPLGLMLLHVEYADESPDSGRKC